jgi:hypothetical protein
MIVQLLIFSIITASISFTISESRLFENFRELMHDKNHLLGKLFSCGYCLGHWIAICLVITYQFKIIDGLFIIDFILTALVIAWISAFQWLFMCWLMNLTGK